MTREKTMTTYHSKYVRNMACIYPYDDEVKKALTFKVKSYIGSQEDTIYAYEETKDGLLVPRCFVPAPVDEAEWIHIDIPFHGRLRKYQQALCDRWLDVGQGIIASSTGSGKTVMALYIAHKIGLKTLIVVSSAQLLEQWCERVKEFCGFAPSIIRGSICDYSAPITVGMIHTLAFGKNIPRDNLLTVFGLTIYDEVHHLGAPVFNRAVQIFWDKHRLGLSATPKRSDGLTPLIEYHIGEVVAYYGKALVKPLVFLVRYYDRDCSLEGCFTYDGEINMPRYINRLSKALVRNRMIVLFIEKMMAKERRILVLSDRKEQIEILRSLLVERGHSDRVAVMTGEKREEPRQVILATYGVCGEGFDMPELDCLILATPRFKIKQPLGRLLRPKEKKPIVIDIVDNSLSRLLKSREAFYTHQDIEYKTVTVHRGHVLAKWGTYGLE